MINNKYSKLLVLIEADLAPRGACWPSVCKIQSSSALHVRCTFTNLFHKFHIVCLKVFCVGDIKQKSVLFNICKNKALLENTALQIMCVTILNP